MKKIIGLMLLFVLPLLAFCQDGMKSISLYENKITIKLPEKLQQLTNTTNVDYLFSDDNKTLRFLIFATTDQVTDNNIPSYTDDAISAVKQSGEGAVIYDDGISLNAGKNIGYIKYGLDAGADKGFNYVFYGSSHEKLVTFFFNCPKTERALWEKRIDAVVASVMITDKNIE